MDWHTLIVNTVVAILGIVIPSLGVLLGKLLVHAIQNSRFGQLNFLAGVAVKWAEDAYSTADGSGKLVAAVDKLADLGKVDHKTAEALVRSAYQSIFGQLDTLKNQPAPLPTTPTS